MEQTPDLAQFFNPRSIAIVGVSTRPGSISGQFLAYLTRFGYKGQIYPVNPRHQEVAGRPCYGRLADIPDNVDLCLIVTPKQAVRATVVECAEKKVPYVVIPAAGFGEAGPEGAKVQEELMAIARTSHMRLVGPNCMGFINFKERVALSFGGFLADVENLAGGNVAFVSQSGAFGGGMVRRCLKEGIGFTYHVSTGNEADLDALDFMEYYIEDPDTRVIGAFIEGIKDASRLVAVGRKARLSGKVIVVLKGGKSARGAQAVGSHTGRIAGSADVYRGIFAQAGMIEVASARELSAALETLSQVNFAPPCYAVAAVVASGGSGILASDYCEVLGLSFPELSQKTQSALSSLVPEAGSCANPVDITAQVPHNEIQKLPSIIDLVCKEEGVGVIMLSIANLHLERCWREVLEIVGASGRLLAVGSSGGLSGPTRRELAKSGRAIVGEDVWDALQKVAFVVKRQGLNHKTEWLAPSVRCGKHDHHALPAPAGGVLTEHQAKRLLAPYLQMPRGKLASSIGEAVGIADEFGYPVVLKLVAPGLLHKTESGAVKLHIDSPDSLAKSFAELMERAPAVAGQLHGVLVEEQVERGTEVILGFLRKPELGPLVMFGSGGILVELIRDVSYRSLPAGREDLAGMVRETLSYKLLRGFRNQPAGDVEGLLDLMTEASALFLANPWMKELEFNPIVVLPAGRGVRALDVVLTT
ncbi:MAG: acetate--CoA ligase family protein [Deltaproteobacteria bacterium]|nr:acetate--CoA ligase family protein [Deltaproteobacteria bacterium]